MAFLTVAQHFVVCSAILTSSPVCIASCKILVASLEMEKADEADFTGSVSARPPSLTGRVNNSCSLSRTSLPSRAGVNTCCTENILPTRSGWHVVSPRSGRHHFQLSWHGSVFIHNLRSFGQWTFDCVVPVGGSGVSACRTVYL